MLRRLVCARRHTKRLDGVFVEEAWVWVCRFLCAFSSSLLLYSHGATYSMHCDASSPTRSSVSPFCRVN